MKQLDYYSNKTPIMEYYESNIIEELPDFGNNIWTISNESVLHNFTILSDIGMKPILMMEQFNIDLGSTNNNNSPYDAIYFYSNFTKIRPIYKYDKINVMNNVQIVANIIGQRIDPIDTMILFYELNMTAEILTINGINEYKYSYVCDEVKNNLLHTALLAKEHGYDVIIMDSYGIKGKGQPIKNILQMVHEVSNICNIPIIICIPCSNNKQNGSKEITEYKTAKEYISRGFICKS